MTAMTISRQLGSHGDEIAANVAQALGLRLIDAKTINQAAQQAGVPEVALAEIEPEGERGMANQILKALRAMPALPGISTAAVVRHDEAASAEPEMVGLSLPFAGLFSPAAPPLSASLDSYIRMVGLVVRGLARQGDVLIVGRGAQVLLRNHPQTLHVQLVAPQAYRTKVIMERLGLDRRQALDRIRASDRARASYLRRYHDVDWLDPTLYDLVINTGRVSVATATELIITAWRAMLSRANSTVPVAEG